MALYLSDDDDDDDDDDESKGNYFWKLAIYDRRFPIAFM